MRRSITKKYGSVIFFILLLAVVFMAGCGGVSKMVNSATKLGQESQRLEKMTAAEVENLVSKDIDMERIKRDPDGVVGQYVKLQGKANLEGTKDFPLKKGMVKTGKRNENEGMVLLLDDMIFVIAIDNSSAATIKTGDQVEILGFVSESRFLRAMSEMYPKEKMPDYVTIIAKTVKKIEPAETTEAPADAAGNIESTPPPSK